MSDVPASFLPPPKRKAKTFDDVRLVEVMETIAAHDARLTALEAEALADNPDAGKAVPWQKTRKGRAR